MNVRVPSSVLLVSIWDDINVIKKLHLYPFGWYGCNFLFLFFITFISFQINTRIILEGGLAFLKIKIRRSSSIPQDKNKKLERDFDKGQNLRKMIQ
jgi:hypothetical protein